MAWALTAFLLYSYSAGVTSLNDSLQTENAKLLTQRNAAMQIAKQFQRSQCGT